MKEDLRFIKTEENLKKAFLDLLKEQPIDKITTLALCNKAKCSRNAFYQHYGTKYDLFNYILQEIIENIKKGCQPVADDIHQINEQELTQYSYNVLKGVYDNKDEISIYLKNNSDFIDTLRKSMCDSMMKTSSVLLKNHDSVEIKLFNHYMASAVAGFIEYWLLETNLSLTEAQELINTFSREAYRWGRDYDK